MLISVIKLLLIFNILLIFKSFLLRPRHYLRRKSKDTVVTEHCHPMRSEGSHCNNPITIVAKHCHVE